MSAPRSRAALAGLAVAIALLASGCGQTGPLYHPQPEPPPEPAASGPGAPAP